MLDALTTTVKGATWSEIAAVILFAAEILLVGFFIFELFIRKNKKIRSVIFLIAAFAINASLYIIPCVYSLKGDTVTVFDVMACFSDAFKTFVGEWDAVKVKEFAAEFPFYTVTYVLGSILAPIAAANAAAQAFSLTLIHNVRRWSRLRAKTCDILIGTGDKALQYAKDHKAVLVTNSAMDSEAVNQLIERGYTVWSTSFTSELLSGRRLNLNTEYNIICPGSTEENLEHINTFIAYRKAEGDGRKKKLHMFVEIEGKKTEIIRREVIEKSCCKESITPFCSDGLLAVKFAQEHPVTEKIPESFIKEDCSIDRDAKINVIYLGFGSLNRAIYRRSVLNNQLTHWDDGKGEYLLHPVNYYLVDNGIDCSDWLIDGLKNGLKELEADKDEYYPIPELPYNTVVRDLEPASDEAVKEAIGLVDTDRSFNYIIVDVGNSYNNIELGTNLRRLFGARTNYHIYIRCDTAYIEDDEYITYLGDITDIFTHDMIVNDSMFELARRINEMYTLNSLSEEQKKDQALVDERIKAADAKWKSMDSFTKLSNFFAAMNLRVKLQLMGLDYVTNGAEEDVEAIKVLEAFLELRDAHKEYADYFKRSKRNAMLSQEKARWNAYHLYKKVLPKRSADVKEGKGTKTFDTGKNLTEHACITTFKGLDALHQDQLSLNPTGSIEDVECYKYDDQLLCSTVELMRELGYTIVKKK